jgi:hypothetical protein
VSRQEKSNVDALSKRKKKREQTFVSLMIAVLGRIDKTNNTF